MEGLIPFVIHAFKRNRMLKTYRSLSLSEAGSNRGETASLMELQQQQEGSSHHRRTRSEYTAAAFASTSTSTEYYLSSGGATHRHVAASRGMGKDAFRASGAAATA